MKPRYLIFDIESVADGDLVSTIRYPGEGLSAKEALFRFTAELVETKGSDFIPYTFHIPVAVAVAKVGEDFRLLDLVTIDSPEYRPHVITENFWRGWSGYSMPTFVTFNGRGFDLPLMELAAFRYGIAIPDWFNLEARSYEQRRNRYNQRAHIDLQDVLTNFSATRFNGGLNLAAHLLGCPGKMDTVGHMVQELYDEGNLERINRYCCCDVLDTYFVFLRVAVMQGKLSLEAEQSIVAETEKWLRDRTDEFPVYSIYLNERKTWPNPWINTSSSLDTSSSVEEE